MKKGKLKISRNKHQSQLSPGFFLYRAILTRNIHINPDIKNELVDRELKNKMKAVILENKEFCEKYCGRDFWTNTFAIGPCFLLSLKKKLNEFHTSKSARGKFRCKLLNQNC